jgi:general secretion pathway protein G
MTKEFELKSHKTVTLDENKSKKITSNTNQKQEKTVLKTTKNAFTLLELLVVIAILGMLAAFVVPAVVDKKDEAQRKITCTQMAGVESTLESFKMDNSKYPETEEGLEALVSNPDTDKYPQYARAPYYKKLPKDTWGTPFIYLREGDSFKIISYAGDRKEGGTKGDEDIIYPGCDK